MCHFCHTCRRSSMCLQFAWSWSHALQAATSSQTFQTLDCLSWSMSVLQGPD